jgi:hypothetical protein
MKQRSLWDRHGEFICYIYAWECFRQSLKIKEGERKRTGWDLLSRNETQACFTVDKERLILLLSGLAN